MAHAGGADRMGGVRSGAERPEVRSGAARSGAERSRAELTGVERSGSERSGAEPRCGAVLQGAERSGALPAGVRNRKGPGCQRQTLDTAESFFKRTDKTRTCLFQTGASSSVRLLHEACRPVYRPRNPKTPSAPS